MNEKEKGLWKVIDSSSALIEIQERLVSKTQEMLDNRNEAVKNLEQQIEIYKNIVKAYEERNKFLEMRVGASFVNGGLLMGLITIIAIAIYVIITGV